MRIGMGAAQHSYLSSPLLPPPPLSPPPPPPPPTPSKSNNMPMLYYGVLVVGTAAIVLAIYNLLIIRWCADSYRPQRQQGQGTTPARRLEQRGAASSQGFDNPNLNLISNTFKYKRGGGGGGAKDQANDCECAVCLSVFEEGEEVRQLPRCKHLFHAPCIDMWLHSHLDCPLCRSRVEPPALCRSPLAPPIPNRYMSTPRQARGVSADALLEPSMFAL